MIFKQHTVGFVLMKEKSRGRYKRLSKREAAKFFPLIFEKVKGFDLHKFNAFYGFSEEPERAGIYDGRFMYDGL